MEKVIFRNAGLGGGFTLVRVDRIDELGSTLNKYSGIREGEYYVNYEPVTLQITMTGSWFVLFKCVHKSLEKEKKQK